MTKIPTNGWEQLLGSMNGAKTATRYDVWGLQGRLGWSGKRLNGIPNFAIFLVTLTPYTNTD